MTDNSKNKGRGRPTKMTPDRIRKLENAFSYGFTDREACLYAGISTQTLHRYCRETDPDFRERKEALKDRPKMSAKRNIVDKINGGCDSTSRWYLERKASDEYSTKITTDNTHNVNQDIILNFNRAEDED